jgi:hypothetical protein
MKKELKEFIKAKKLSDESILKLLQATANTPAEETSEPDVKDEADDKNESESQPDSKKTDESAEKPPAEKKEADKPAAFDIEKVVAEAVAKALRQERKKDAPQPHPSQYKPNEWGIRDR